jgi:hypothetical protein
VKHELRPDLFPLVIPRAGSSNRHAGLHMSDVRDLVGRALKAKGCDYPAPDGDNIPETLTLAAHLGFAWEDILARALADTWGREGNLVMPYPSVSCTVTCPTTGRTRDLHASPDGVILDLLGRPAILEAKVRFASCDEKWDPEDPGTIAWKQCFQSKVYAHMLGFTRVVIAVLHINGSYGHGRPGFPVPMFHLVEYEPSELADWWAREVVPAVFQRGG